MHPWKYLGFLGRTLQVYTLKRLQRNWAPQKKDGGPQNRIWDRLENPWDS